uniref:MYND-type domain-containing protein n=1 Tax=Eutreptiella gymnastica TaxID=73025 RepID=A0A7S4CE35_9EUGL
MVASNPVRPGQTLFLARVGPQKAPFVRVVDLPPQYKDLAALNRNQEDSIYFLRHLSQAMHGQMLAAVSPVPCSACSKQAMQLQITPQCFGNANQNFILVDPVIPLCSSKQCCDASVQLAQAISGDARAMGFQQHPGQCNRCSAQSGPSKGPLMLCGQCQNVWYCSVDCQRADWPNHKMFCRPVG